LAIAEDELRTLQGDLEETVQTWSFLHGLPSRSAFLCRLFLSRLIQMRETVCSTSHFSPCHFSAHFYCSCFYVCSRRTEWNRRFMEQKTIKLEWHRPMRRQMDWDNLHRGPDHIHVRISIKRLYIYVIIPTSCAWIIISYSLCRSLLVAICRRLSSFGLSGTLSGDIQSLSALQNLYATSSLEQSVRLYRLKNV
jgi:hypothetical protein